MPKFARRENNIVVETMEAEKIHEHHPSSLWRECPEQVKEGWGDDGVSFTDPEDIITVEEVKNSRISEVISLREGYYNAGFNYNGATFQIDSEAQKDMLAIQTQFLLGIVNPHNGFWKDQDNNNIVMNDVEVKAFFQAAFARVYEIKSNAWAHKENLNNLYSKQELREYDITTGWNS